MTFLSNFSLFQIFITVSWVESREEGAKVFLYLYIHDSIIYAQNKLQGCGEPLQFPYEKILIFLKLVEFKEFEIHSFMG